MDATRSLVANMDNVSSYLGVNVSLATASAFLFVCLVGNVPPRGKFVVSVIFNPGFEPFLNCHD